MKIKKYFPKKLFSRFLLIIILPVFIVQIISTYIFYQTHVQSVVKRISRNTISKIVFINKNFKTIKDYNDINLYVKFYKNEKIRKKDIIKNTDKYVFFNQEQFFIDNLLHEINEPLSLQKDNDNFMILIQKDDGILSITANKKDLIVKTAKIFIFWSFGLSFITLFIAILFMKNQLKPIKLLKKHVNNFSLNQKIAKYKPTGAKEIRELGISFVEMEKRLKQFVDQRTIMLAGISHDLRTPLTRMKLELEMIELEEKSYLIEDIDYMDNIINQYLNFTKCIKKEDKILVNIYDYVFAFVKKYKKLKNNLSLKTKNLDRNELVLIQPLAFERVLSNILDNAFKFGTKAMIILTKLDYNNKMIIEIEDNGCGVKPEDLDKLSEPFFKINKSRNDGNKGVGLGLTIAKDIILANNGKIYFEKSKILKGLNVCITLNVNKEF